MLETKTRWRLLLPFLTVIYLTGCATSTLNLDSHVPSALFFSPESSGGFLNGRGQFLVGSAHKESLGRSTQTATIFSSSPSAVVVETTPEQTANMSLGAALNLGLLSRFDLFLEARTEAPTRLGVQYQVLGSKFGDNGFKFSLISSVGYNKDKDVGRKDSWGDQSEKLSNVSGQMRDRSWSGGFSTGLRFSPSFLTFVSANYQEDDFQGDLSIQGGNSYSMIDLTQTTTAVVGAELSTGEKPNKLYLHAEVGLSKIESRFGGEFTRRVWGLSMGGTF